MRPLLPSAHPFLRRPFHSTLQRYHLPSPSDSEYQLFQFITGVQGVPEVLTYRRKAHEVYEVLQRVASLEQEAKRAGNAARFEALYHDVAELRREKERYDGIARDLTFRHYNPTYETGYIPHELKKIDLHGLYMHEAARTVYKHLKTCRQWGVYKTTIVTGHGYGRGHELAYMQRYIYERLATLYGDTLKLEKPWDKVPGRIYVRVKRFRAFGWLNVWDVLRPKKSHKGRKVESVLEEGEDGEQEPGDGETQSPPRDTSTTSLRRR